MVDNVVWGFTNPIQSNPIQCDMTGAGGASLPASQMTIYYIQTGRPPVPVKSQS